MSEKLPIRFGGIIHTSENLSGILTWLCTGLLICTVIWLGRYFSPILVFGFLGFSLLVFLPALCGSFIGWFLGGVRNECKQFRHHRKIERSFR